MAELDEAFNEIGRMPETHYFLDLRDVLDEGDDLPFLSFPNPVLDERDQVPRIVKLLKENPDPAPGTATGAGEPSSSGAAGGTILKNTDGQARAASLETMGTAAAKRKKKKEAERDRLRSAGDESTPGGSNTPQTRRPQHNPSGGGGGKGFHPGQQGHGGKKGAGGGKGRGKSPQHYAHGPQHYGGDVAYGDPYGQFSGGDVGPYGQFSGGGPGGQQYAANGQMYSEGALYSVGSTRVRFFQKASLVFSGIDEDILGESHLTPCNKLWQDFL